VLCSTLLFPLTELLALLWLLIPLRLGRRPPGFALVLRTIVGLRPWGMIEVFMLGILVALVKLSGVARVIPDVALFAFGVLTILLAAVIVFDLRGLWHMFDALPAADQAPRPPQPAQSRYAAPSSTPAAHSPPPGRGKTPC